MAWDTRFKRASAAKRRAKEGQPERDRQAEYQMLVDAARMADLPSYMQGIGMPIRRDGTKDWVVDHLYRVSKKQDGHFVWCSHDQSRGGDSIAFCTEELGLSFQQALVDLGGRGRLHETKRNKVSHSDQYPSPPPVSRDPYAVIGYLEGRGISRGTISQARASGFLRFVAYADTPGAAFCGKDAENRLRSITVRLIRPIRSFDGQKEITKIDIRHSDKSFPAIWRSDRDSDSVCWIVEGGIDALAVIDWHKASQAAEPSIIVSGGSGVRGFLDQPHVQQLLQSTSKVYIALERERNEGIQIKTDADHSKQISKLQSMGFEVVPWMPPVGSKDIADAWKSGALGDAKDPLAHMRQSLETQLWLPEEIEVRNRESGRLENIDPYS